MISKFAKKGMTPSQIGVLLRDSHGVAQVKSVTGSKILRILKGQGTRRVPAIPEGLLLAGHSNILIRQQVLLGRPGGWLAHFAKAHHANAARSLGWRMLLMVPSVFLSWYVLVL